MSDGAQAPTAKMADAPPKSPAKHDQGSSEIKKKVPLYEKPGWQLFAICYLVGVQSSLTTGFVNSCYSTLEKLFNFNSKFTGMIEGSFHVAIVLLVIPVSFYGRSGNKPVIMALGAALIAIGAFCYASAEFFREQPFSVLNVTHTSGSDYLMDKNGCSGHTTDSASPTPTKSELESPWVKWLFVTGMFLIGVGSTPIQTVAIAYLDRNNEPSPDTGGKPKANTGWALGWFHAVGLLAPACGFVLSGSFLSMPIDFSSWTLSKDDASFMGAWWMGFMLECALALLLVPILLTLPSDTKGSAAAPTASMDAESSTDKAVLANTSPPTLTDKEFEKETPEELKAKIAKELKNEGCGDSSPNMNTKSPPGYIDSQNNDPNFQVQTQPDLSPKLAIKLSKEVSSEENSRAKEWAEFKTCFKCLLADKTFICLLLHGSVLHLTTAGLTAFIPKFFETQYRMIAQIAAFVAGGVSVPAAALGAIISGYLIKRLNLSCLGTIKMTFMAQGLCIVLTTIFFIIRCPYGHVYQLDEIPDLANETGLNLTTNNCHSSHMRITCINQQYNVYSPCVLPCYTTKGECGRQNISVSLELCEPGACYWRGPAFVLFFITFLCASMVAVPRIFALLRLVQDEWKTISLGIQWVFFRLLGMIPGPLLYGQIFDSACSQWGSITPSISCTESHSGSGEEATIVTGAGSGHCSFYNSVTLRNYMIVVTVGSLIVGEICLFFAIHFYKVEHEGPGKKPYIASPEPCPALTSGDLQNKPSSQQNSTAV